jgi:hypothetical protein
MYGVSKKRKRNKTNYGELPCAQYKTIFIKRRPKQEFCCGRCRVYHFRERVDKRLKIHFRPSQARCAYRDCGTLFTKQVAHQRFCSDIHRVKDFIKHQKDKREEYFQEEYMANNRAKLRAINEKVMSKKREDL